MSWPRKRLKYHRKYGIFTKSPPPKFSTCPLDTFGPFLVWDGQKFIKDHYFELNCAIDRIDTVIGGKHHQDKTNDVVDVYQKFSCSESITNRMILLVVYHNLAVSEPICYSKRETS